MKNGIEIDGVRYRSIDAELERKQGGNVWMSVALREGKNREIKRVLEHLDLKVNRLIRCLSGLSSWAILKPGRSKKCRAACCVSNWGANGTSWSARKPRPTVNVLMRIVGGEFGGTPLSAPKGRTTRPTGERTREALFSILRRKPIFPRARGCWISSPAPVRWGLRRFARRRFCLFVENDTRVRGTLRDNCDACGVLGRTKIYRRDATRLGPRVRPPGRFSIWFLPTRLMARNWPMPRWRAGRRRLAGAQRHAGG